jgi:hypothetical protein
MAIDKQAKEFFKEIKGLEELLKEDLDSWDPRSLPGKRAQHAQARNRLAELKREYAKWVGQNAAAIFVDGEAEKVEQFTKLAEEKGGTITVDGRGVYKILAAEIFPTLRKNQVDFNHVGILQGRLSHLVASVGYFGPSNVRFTKLFDRTFTTEESLIEAIRQICMYDLGDMLNMGVISQQIVDRAFASGATNSPVPCVIHSAGEDDKTLLTGLIFGGRFVNVTVEGDIVPHTVTKAFNALKTKLKSSTETNEEPNNTTKEN